MPPVQWVCVLAASMQIINYKLKVKIGMQSKNAITIVHVMTGMYV